MANRIDRYAGKIVSLRSCVDLVLIQETIPSVCQAKAVETHPPRAWNPCRSRDGACSNEMHASTA